VRGSLAFSYKQAAWTSPGATLSACRLVGAHTFDRGRRIWIDGRVQVGLGRGSRLRHHGSSR
jgi:hypothetical protein